MTEEKANILLVDDKPENLLSLEAILDGPDHNLVKATSGPEALRHVLRHDFAVILLDVQMPGMDGFETADLIKEREKSKHTPIIFLTAISRSDIFVSKGYSVGAVDYILKPIVPEILRSKVRVFVDLFRMTEQVKRLNEALERRAIELQTMNDDLEAEVAIRKKSEEQVRRLNDELEIRVIERTAQLQQANRELENEIAERKRLEAQKDEFIAIASHELRTPLTAIKGYAKLALRAVEGAGDERATRSLRIVAEKTDLLTKLMNDMLDVSRIEHDVLPLNYEPFDMCGLVREAVSSVQLAAPDFEFMIDVPDEQITIEADRQRIEQVITNLLENAVKYTGKAASETPTIVASVKQSDSEVVTSIRDHGVGIPADQQDQVFSRFFRASNVTSARYPYPGMGLGLFIAHNIVQRHGGRIWVESTESRGSTFSFAIPATRTEELPISNAVEQLHQ